MKRSSVSSRERTEAYSLKWKQLTVTMMSGIVHLVLLLILDDTADAEHGFSRTLDGRMRCCHIASRAQIHDPPTHITHSHTHSHTRKS